MKKKDYISGGFLLLISVILFFQSRNLPFWGKEGPSVGFFPFILSFLLGVFSLVTIFQAWWKTQPKEESFKILGPARRDFFLYLAAFFLFSLVFTKVGYSLTTAAFFILTLKIVEKQSWKMTLAVILISIAASYMIFILFLSVPLPEGILSPMIPPGK